MTCIDGYAMARKGRAGRGARHRRGRLLRRRHRQRGRADAAGAAARRVRAALRAARVLRAAAARPARARLHERGLDAEVARDGGARAAARHDRHRPDDRLLPLRLRRGRAGRRHRRRAGGRRALRRSPRSSPPPGRRRRRTVIKPQLARAAALAPGVARVGGADRPRHRARLPDRHRARLGPHHLELRVLRGRAAAVEAARGVRPRARWRAWRGRSRPTTRRPPAPSCRCWRSACRRARSPPSCWRR